MGISLEQNPASHGFTSTYFNFSFSLSNLVFARPYIPAPSRPGAFSSSPPARRYASRSPSQMLPVLTSSSPPARRIHLVSLLLESSDLARRRAYTISEMVLCLQPLFFVRYQVTEGLCSSVSLSSELIPSAPSVFTISQQFDHCVCSGFPSSSTTLEPMKPARVWNFYQNIRCHISRCDRYESSAYIHTARVLPSIFANALEILGNSIRDFFGCL